MSESTDEAKRRLRAALDGVVLTPETTRDDAPDKPAEQDKSRSAEMIANKPPHHG